MASVYAVQSTAGGSVKIGCSADVPTRIRQLEAHYGCELVLLCEMPGGRDEEKAIHERFAHLRFGKTEQFRPEADLMAFLGRPLLVGANPETVEAMQGRVSRGTLVRMDDDLCVTARKLAAIRGVSMAKLFVDILAPIVEREYTKELAKETRKHKGEGGAT